MTCLNQEAALQRLRDENAMLRELVAAFKDPRLSMPPFLRYKPADQVKEKIVA